jgi:aerobic carbon-monoxide dehydrogenase medium subunit
LDASLADAADAVRDAHLDTVDDVHCSAEYRREMAEVQVRRAIRAAVEGRGR